MKIQGKLYSIVALLGVIAIGVALLGIRLMQGYNEQVDAFQLASQRAYDGEHLNRLITAVVMDSRGVYAAKDVEKAKPFAEGIVKSLKAIDELLVDWSARVPDDRKAAFDAVVAKAKEFKTFRTETARLGTEESPAAANEQGNNDANRNNRKQLQADVDKLVELDRQDLDAVRASIQEYYVAGRQTLIIFAVVGILAGIAIASWIGAAKIAGPLKRVNGALGDLTQGKMDVSIPVKIGRDEIGLLWSTVGTFRDTLVETERLKAAQAETEAQRRAEQKALLDRLAREFETEVGEVLAAVTQTAQSTLKAAEVMVTDAEETSGRSIAVASASEQTSANVQAVAGASEELSSSISEIGRQIGEASTLIGAAVEQARLTDHDVRSLADSASKVGTIVAMIQAIAEQTNLLALNATIEAARAGEAGRGFAVVASEVKALASQTAKATQDIEAQMGTIQGATQQSVEKIADISRRIAELDHITSSISGAATQQNAATGEIARNISEAAVGAAEVAQTIVGVRTTAEKSGAASRDLLDRMSHLAKQSAVLEQKVSAFVGTIRAA
ncbi:methyl-accepting chemotaxis protein [Pleomorphomonas diazotrophica]|uniref:Methyl-accepting chemotaxis protein n=1 Tax=Pleomorphomonas diazotrophica TaxID=1166257 RepID=A0A1I4VG24_9HYPH|nr:methyl-accepting chemotaxis protein [Pleomorphomonas diazotrophica]PKR90091.1 methyl-accepting chemotaxis protein [Pleomorphomonas diazotrophica]SFN00187.1 methyl-accepting chemotaxis protein [Pleomorphomonas diazotrophica]